MLTGRGDDDETCLRAILRQQLQLTAATGSEKEESSDEQVGLIEMPILDLQFRWHQAGYLFDLTVEEDSHERNPFVAHLVIRNKETRKTRNRIHRRAKVPYDAARHAAEYSRSFLPAPAASRCNDDAARSLFFKENARLYSFLYDSFY